MTASTSLLLIIMSFSRLILFGAASALCISCESLNQPLSNSSGFDPLGTPGAQSTREIVKDTGPRFSAGSFVNTSIPDSAFFRSVPRGNASADRLLSSGESVKVIGQEKSYVKVELEDGSIGYIPSMMLAEPLSSNARIVAGSGATSALPLEIPDLPEPIEDPGNPDDAAPLLPNFDDDTPVAPLPQGGALSPLPKPSAVEESVANPLAPLPVGGAGAIQIVPVKPEGTTGTTGAEDEPPPLPTPAN